MHNKVAPWTLAIIAARESIDTLARCLGATLTACESHGAVIDVVINGNAELAEAAATLVRSGTLHLGPSAVRVWSIKVGDKAHAWNQYVHHIWPGGEIAFFLDGYVEARRDAFTALSRRLAEAPEALGVTGVPSSGRSAAKTREYMIRHGGIQGNMHALRGEAMVGIRERGLRLPLGLYRTDSLVGALLLLKLSPESAKWEPRRMAVAADATWDIPGQSAITFRNVKAQFKRVLRQAQGELENRALREHMTVRRLPAQQLPETVAELVGHWITSQPEQAKSLLKRPTCRYAAYKLRHPRDWSAAKMAPQLLHASAGLAGSGELGKN
jgi:hypothetical protein